MLSFALFRDRTTMRATFIAADVFDAASPLMTALRHGVDVIVAGDFLHQFD